MKSRISAAAAAAAVLLTACSDSEPPAVDRVEAQAVDVTIVSPAPDNLTGAATTNIAATVFVPAHAPGETYPLILHSHGWGGDRITAADAAANAPDEAPTDFYSVILDRQVRHLWDAGYAVISFDERGFGGSGGASRVMDPDYETRDAIAVLDWAEANLDLRRDAAGDPYVGSIGGSYGGGFQLLLAAFDPRLDALVPGATWHDLVQSLVPNRVIKKLYVTGLCVAAVQAQRRLDPQTHQACAEAADNAATRFEEDVSAATVAFLGGHGLRALQARHADPDDPFKMRRVDALFVQGQRDVLFPVNQALANYAFLKSLGGDVRLLSNQHGHILPASLSSQPRLGAWGCGPTDSLEALRRWFDAKLRGSAAGLDYIPELCLSLDDARAVHVDAVPEGSASHAVTIAPTDVTGAQNDFGGAAPTFIPLGAPIAGDDLVLAGIPVADLSVSGPAPGTGGTAFVGIGLRRGDAAPVLVDDQLNPLRSGDAHDARPLLIVAEKLQAGDQVGVLLYGAHHQYEPANKSNFTANAYTISGTVKLPIQALPVAQ